MFWTKYPSDALRWGHAYPELTTLGVLRMTENPWDSKCGPRTAPCIPGILGACAPGLPVADILQRGVSLWVHRHSQWDTTQDDSSHGTWVSPCTQVDLGLSICTLLIVFKLILYYIHIVLVNRSWLSWNIIFIYIYCTIFIDINVHICQMFLELFVS